MRVPRCDYLCHIATIRFGVAFARWACVRTASISYQPDAVPARPRLSLYSIHLHPCLHSYYFRSIVYCVIFALAVLHLSCFYNLSNDDASLSRALQSLIAFLADSLALRAVCIFFSFLLPDFAQLQTLLYPFHPLRINVTSTECKERR